MRKLLLVMMLILTLVSCGKKENIEIKKEEYITYNTNGGEELDPQLITDNLKLMIPDKKGYYFSGWKDDEGRFVSESDIKSSIHLNAVYTVKRSFLIIINITNTGIEYLEPIIVHYGDKIVPKIDREYYKLTLDDKPYEYGTEIVITGIRKIIIYS